MTDRKRSAERPEGSDLPYRERAGGFAFAAADPRSAEAAEAMFRYFAELDERFDGGFDPGDITAGVEAYAPPNGRFVLVRCERPASPEGVASPAGPDQLAACGALQRLDDDTAEVKRMWVNPEHRGLGLGRRLLEYLEQQAVELGYTRIVLDTNGTLSEAIALYERSGYEAIARYNDNPYAQRWFAKSLPPSR